MNQGRRYIRNTVLGLYGALVLFFGVNRLVVAMAGAGAPEWAINTATLGLAYVTRTGSGAQYLSAQALHDFTRVHVRGRFAVEITGGAEYHLSFTAANGRPLPLGVKQEGEQLWLTGLTTGNKAGPALLRIQMPALAALDARLLTGLTLRGLQSPHITVDLNDVSAARLAENKVGQWVLHSDDPAEVQVDKATLAAGEIQVSGAVAIRSGK